jgi:alpha-beta hydrolase superfamily lysophospholipase
MPIRGSVTSSTDQVLLAEDGTHLKLSIARSPAPKGSIIVVHGVGDRLTRYGALSSWLVKCGYHCYRYDQRGHGGSTGRHTDVGRFVQYVHDLERVRQAVGSDDPALPQHVFGHSMGALVALLHALHHPDVWRSAIVQGCPVALAHPMPKWIETIGRILSVPFPLLRFPTGIRPEQLSHDPEAVEGYRLDPELGRNVTLRWGVELLRAQRHLRDEAARILVPLLILHGEADEVSSVAGSRWLYKRVASEDKELVVYPGLRHELHNERLSDRARVFKDLLDWLERHRGDRTSGGVKMEAT